MTKLLRVASLAGDLSPCRAIVADTAAMLDTGDLAGAPDAATCKTSLADLFSTMDAASGAA